MPEKAPWLPLHIALSAIGIILITVSFRQDDFVLSSPLLFLLGGALVVFALFRSIRWLVLCLLSGAGCLASVQAIRCFHLGKPWFFLPVLLFFSAMMCLRRAKYHSLFFTRNMKKVDRMDGRTFEFWAAELLRRNGFHHVRVTQESGDQGVDIVASRLGAKYAIQCKCYSGRIGNHAVQEVFAGKEIYGCKHAAVLTNQYFTKGGIEAAEKTGVLLWDRDWIIDAL